MISAHQAFNAVAARMRCAPDDHFDNDDRTSRFDNDDDMDGPPDDVELDKRCRGWTSALCNQIWSGTATLATLEAHALDNREPEPLSRRQEMP